MLTSKNIPFKEIIPFNLQRKVVSHMTTSSWKEVPLVTYLYEPDVTDFYETFKKQATQEHEAPTKITFNTLMLKTVVEGLLAAPKLNALLEYNHRTVNGRLLVCEEINISLPWLLADGRMITPIVAQANQMSLIEISAAITSLKQKIDNTNIDEMLYQSAMTDTARELRRFNPRMVPRLFSALLGKQRMDHLRGKEKKEYYTTPADQRLTEKDIMEGTVTLSNIGSLYREQHGTFGLLEVVPPQVLAVGISALQEKPGILHDETGTTQIGVRKFLPMCLAFDHRAVDFDTLIPFLKRLDDIFAHPQQIAAW